MGLDIEPLATLDDPSQAELATTQGLKLIDQVILPHFGRGKYEERHKKIIEQFGGKYKLLPLGDEEMVVIEGKRNKIVSSVSAIIGSSG